MVLKLITSVWHTSTAPRDAAVITPTFSGTLISADAESLVEDWLDAFQTWSGIGTTSQIQCKAVDAQGTKPVFPEYETMRNVGVAANVGSPREIAVCLSFFSDRNVPRRRGRLYIPFYWLYPASALAARPSTTVMDKVGALQGHLTALGGANVDWSVFSKVDNTARKVTHWYVDDEWDTQRRRGLRPTTRAEGTTGE